MAAAAQDQRQRTLQALERRFEAAKAELDLHQTKTTKRLKTDTPLKKPPIPVSSAPDSSPNLSIAPSITPSKKGNIIFTGYVNSQDIDENGPTYAKISQTIHEKLMAPCVEASDRLESKVDNVLHGLLQSGDSAQKYMQRSRSKRIDNWILLDNYVQGRGGAAAARAKALKSNSKRSRKRMSMKQQKKQGLFDFPKELHNYDKFKPMHEIWKGYITQLLRTTGKIQFAPTLLKADLHGAIISVADCKVTSHTGVCGIMIRETAKTFGIITQENKFRGRDEYKEFEKLIQEDLKEVDNRLEEEEIDAAEIIEEAESVEEKTYREKVKMLRKKRMELKAARAAKFRKASEFVKKEPSDEESSDDSDGDVNFAVDWRSLINRSECSCGISSPPL